MNQQEIFEALLVKSQTWPAHEMPVIYVDKCTNVVWELSEDRSCMTGHWRQDIVFDSANRIKISAYLGKLFRKEIDRRVKETISKLLDEVVKPDELT